MTEYWISLVLIYFSTQSFGQSLCAAACSGDDMEIFFVGEQFMQMSEWPLLPAFVDVCTFKGEFEDWQTTSKKYLLPKRRGWLSHHLVMTTIMTTSAIIAH